MVVDKKQLNLNGICSEDAKEQARDLFKKRRYYISGSNRILFDPVSEPIQFMFKAATSGLED